MIELSKAAAAEVQRLKVKQKKPNALFRLGVKPGGCAGGMYYTLEFDEAAQPADEIYESKGLQVVVAAETLNYIDGLAIDYSEDLMGGGFRFHNPKATKSCGCSNSFSIDT